MQCHSQTVKSVGERFIAFKNKYGGEYKDFVVGSATDVQAFYAMHGIDHFTQYEMVSCETVDESRFIIDMFLRLGCCYGEYLNYINQLCYIYLRNTFTKP